MSIIKKALIVIYFVIISHLLSGCMFLIGDLVTHLETIVHYVDEAGQDQEQEQEQEQDFVFYEEEKASVAFENRILPYYNDVELCYTGEVYNEQDNICTLPVTCSSSVECAEWGNQVVSELEYWYEGFTDFYGFLNYDYDYSEMDETDSNDIIDDYIVDQSSKNSWLDNFLAELSLDDGYDEEIVAYYELDGLELIIPEQDADEYDAGWYWDEFRWIIPSEQLWMLSSFSLFTDDELLAYVVQEKNDLSSWNLAINISTNIRYQDSISTHVHEFAHLLFLNSKQVNGNQSQLSCLATVYVKDKGCIRENSYMDDFVERFGLDYDQHYDENVYVSEYATNDVLEDMAESFYMFILTQKPTGDSIADEKVLFFYEYDELVMLRATILSRVATYMYRVL